MSASSHGESMRCSRMMICLPLLLACSCLGRNAAKESKETTRAMVYVRTNEAWRSAEARENSVPWGIYRGPRAGPDISWPVPQNMNTDQRVAFLRDVMSRQMNIADAAAKKGATKDSVEKAGGPPAVIVVDVPPDGGISETWRYLADSNILINTVHFGSNEEVVGSVRHRIHDLEAKLGVTWSGHPAHALNAD
jgi:hypothetical protein